MTKQGIIRAIDLCGGAGGWACAARDLPIHIAYAIDRWPEAVMTYRINHPDTKVILQDLLCPIGTEDLVGTCRGQVELVLGGIPCETVSIYRSGWNPATKPKEEEIAAWRALLDRCLQIVEILKPRWWCIEDVAGIVRHLPPLTPWVEIISAGYSPQARSRVYVGEFPMPPRGANVEVMRERLRSGPYRVGTRLWPRDPATSNVYDGAHFQAARPDNKSPTICNFGSRRDAELGIVDVSLPGGKRQMEWQEAAALQGFPSDYLFYGSPTDVSKMVGQAIQIDTGRAILRAIVAEAEKQGASRQDAKRGEEV